MCWWEICRNRYLSIAHLCMLVNLIVFHIGNPNTDTRTIVNLMACDLHTTHILMLSYHLYCIYTITFHILYIFPANWMHSPLFYMQIWFSLWPTVPPTISLLLVWSSLPFLYLRYTRHSCDMGVIQTSRHRVPFKSLIHEDRAASSTFYLFVLYSVFLGIHMLIFLRVVSCLNLWTNFDCLHDTLNFAVWS